MSFFENMFTVFIQVITLAVMIAVGFAGHKLSFFTEKAARMCNNLLFYVITPCVIVNSFIEVDYTPDKAGGFFLAFACAVALHVLGMIALLILFKKGDKDKNAVFRYACMYGNMGYMGLPLSRAVLEAVTGSGELGTFYCSEHIFSQDFKFFFVSDAHAKTLFIV